MTDARSWAEAEFGGAELGDARRTQRLVQIAVSVAERPRGCVTQVISDSAAREGAFRFIENDQVSSAAIGRATHLATAKRCAPHDVMIVAVDQATLTLTDRVGKPGFGRTGPGGVSKITGGFQVMSASAVREDGIVEGLLAQEWFARTHKVPDHSNDRRPLATRESGLWQRAIESAESALADEATNTHPWFQLDRGGDSRAVIEGAIDSHRLITVRSSHNRALERGGYLHGSMRRLRPLGTYDLQLPSTTGAKARVAHLSVRCTRVKLRLLDERGCNRRVVEMWCVHVAERASRRENRLEWWLLTTAPTLTFGDARTVIRNYTARWRIEEFHRAWKSGVCNIEDSQLRSADAFKRWATISAAVAARAERLKTASRAIPESSALSELSRDEIDAAIIISKTHAFAIGDELTLLQAVRLIADIGGYTGKSSGGPPGVRVIQRGLEEVLVGSAVLRATRKK